MDKIIKDIDSFESFKKIFSKSFYKKVVKETLIPIKMERKKFQGVLKELYNDIISGNYSPSILRGRLFTYKSNNVARIIPCLAIKDEALYFFLIKMIEDEVSVNRVKGTFGGWRLGNAIKKLEDSEINYVKNSYNPNLWNENWKEFSKIVHAKIKSKKYDVAYKLDIANFYDNINLNILEKKLLVIVGREKIRIVHLLMYFLKYWNKSIDNYDYKTVGIPQSEFGDQSRLLANFYLQDYDCIISEICLKHEAEYVRYADDQIIFAKNDVNINKIMLNICNELNKIGLNLNASKVRKYNVEELEIYYGYEIINLIEQKKYNDAAKKFFELKKKEISFREDTILKKILTSNLNNYTRYYKKKILKILNQDDVLLNNNLFYINKIYEYLNEKEKALFIEKMKHLLIRTYYNEFHYSILKFATEKKLNTLKRLARKSIKNIHI